MYEKISQKFKYLINHSLTAKPSVENFKDIPMKMFTVIQKHIIHNFKTFTSCNRVINLAGGKDLDETQHCVGRKRTTALHLEADVSALTRILSTCHLIHEGMPCWPTWLPLPSQPHRQH